jgi:2-alkyl-3-oxoalkanoate reductase
MRVFLAGATGAIGKPLVAALLTAGHQVTAMTRSPVNADILRAQGTEPVVCNALDESALQASVVAATPDVVINQLTAIPRRLDPRNIERDFALTNKLRTEGTRNLLTAAQAAGTRKLISQSVAFVYEPTGNNELHDEDDALYQSPPKTFRRTFEAIQQLERTTLDAQGTVLRYGYFYGPGTSLAKDGSLAEQARKRQLPIVGGGCGVWPLIHVKDAANATLAALNGPPGVYNILDDEPAPAHEWIPAFCDAVAAPKPMRVPALLARPIAGSYGVLVMTKSEGATNAKAKHDLGWRPDYASWREGFRKALD